MNDREIVLCRQTGHTRESRFRRLWLKVETMSAEKARLESTLDQLVTRLESEVLPVEQAVAEVCRQTLGRLLMFSERKTLGKKRRMALTPWIDELLDLLLDVGFVEDTLRDRIARHHASVLNVSLDPDCACGDWHQLEAWLERQAAQEACLEWEFPGETEYLADADADADRQLVDTDVSRPADSVAGWHLDHDEAAARKVSGGLDGSVFKRLFQQTAAALHPDKELDEQKRDDKHVLMTRLLQARRDHDLITLMQLHERHAQTKEQLTAADERQLEGVLRQQLRGLHKQMAALPDKSFLHFMAYHRFHDPDAAVVDARISRHVLHLQQRQRAYRRFLEEVATLKQLQQRLHPGHRFSSWLW
ncbi:hypothetical protein ACUNV4_24030 [Granulosicoccus sp. 3-233]|uniref:hypothetical protein n=1 Tax=Granulosicoccus sp. 3-233 TaxID=3417969 RepID=UPI003D34E8C4